MTLPRSQALAGRPSHASHAAQPDSWRTTEGWSSVNPDPGRPHAERVWEQRRALGRRLAALRSRSGFSQWEFAPLTGYSRSTLSDAELGRHRLRREFWERCDGALMSEGMLTAAYDRIEAVATAVRRTARSQAQAAREEQATRRLQALLPAYRNGEVPGGAPATVPDEGALGGCPQDGSMPDGSMPDSGAPDSGAPGGTAANGITWGRTGPAGPRGVASAVPVPPASVPAASVQAGAGQGAAVPAVPPAPRVVPDDGAPDGSVPLGPASSGAAGQPGTTTPPQGQGAPAPLTAMEQCPHCHQPVTVIIVPVVPPAAVPPAPGSSAG